MKELLNYQIHLTNLDLSSNQIGVAVRLNLKTSFPKANLSFSVFMFIGIIIISCLRLLLWINNYLHTKKRTYYKLNINQIHVYMISHNFIESYSDFYATFALNFYSISGKTNTNRVLG
jgi:hypothetical protein